MARYGTAAKTASRTSRVWRCWLAAIAALTLASCQSALARPPSAHAARTLSGTATGHLHLVKPDGSQLIEEGPIDGPLSGSARAKLHVGSVFTGSLTIRTHGGTISGTGTAIPHGSGRFRSFRGLLTVTSGTGRYVHVSGHAGFYGVFDRRTDGVIIQTAGTLHY